MATLSFHGKPIHTCGELPQVGQKAPDFSLVCSKLKNRNLSNYSGLYKVLSIVPSLDTPTCQLSTRKFNQKAGHLANTVVLAVSADLPFAQNRFCETEGIDNVIPLSTFRSDFGRDYGVQLVDSLLAGLTARAIVVIDPQDVVIYTQLVADIAQEPDYDSVWEAVKK